MSIETVTTFFGWCFVINFTLLMASTVGLLTLQKPITRIHSRMFQMSDSELSQAYFQYLGRYKIAMITLSLVPYIALKIMGAE